MDSLVRMVRPCDMVLLGAPGAENDMSSAGYDQIPYSTTTASRLSKEPLVGMRSCVRVYWNETDRNETGRHC